MEKQNSSYQHFGIDQIFLYFICTLIAMSLSMLKKMRPSLPVDLITEPLRSLTIKQRKTSLDFRNPQTSNLDVRKHSRLQKLESIIKSTKQYTKSLKNLRENWTGKELSRSKLITPQKQQQTPLEFSTKVNKLCHYMKTTLIIFTQLFAQTKNKKKIIKRLHGWEDEFDDFLFEEGNICLKRINLNEMILRFGLDKKTAKSGSYFNKLKLLTEQINRSNQQRYQLLSEIQLSKINQKLQIIEEVNDQFRRNYHGKDKHKYQFMAQKTIDRISNFKSKMRSTSQAMKYIQDKTGPIEVNWFFRNQEKMLEQVEGVFLRKDKYY